MRSHLSRVFNDLRCALSENDDDKHICEEPHELKCGHFMCKACLTFGYNSNLCVECKICNVVTKQDDIKNDLPVFKSTFNEHLSDLFHAIYSEFGERLKYCKQIPSDVTESLTTNIEFVKEEVQIRIESMKNDLDALNERLNEELDDIKKNLENNRKKLNEKEFEIEFDNLSSIISSNNQSLNEKDFYKWQNKLQKLNYEIENYKNNIPIVEFKPSKFEIDCKCIGEFVFSNKKFKDLINRIQDDKYIMIDVTKSYSSNCISDLCVLSNGNLVLSDPYKHSLLLFDWKFEFIKEIKKISQSIDCMDVFGLDCNLNDEIYLAEWNSGSVVKINSNFAFINTNYQDPIDRPVGICCYNEFVYVCSVGAKSVLKYDSELNLLSKFKFTYSPWYIKIVNDVACIRSGSIDSCVYFYDISNNFTEIRRHVGHSGSIGTYNSHFFEACSSQQAIFCYDCKGELKFEFKTNSISEFRDSYNGSIGFLNSRLFICNNAKEYLVSF